MLIAGFNKTSFVDYPGVISSVVFTPYCNMNCWYCHNRHILAKSGLNLVEQGQVMDYLEKRAGQIKGVVVSGGEPTLQPDLIYFISQLKELGLLVKLDTNGTNPHILSELIQRGLINYAAMDIKAPLAKYAQTAGADVDTDKIRESISILTGGGMPYEFRTTFAPTLTQEDILEIAEDIRGARAYYLQQYRPYTGQAAQGTVAVYPKAHARQYVLETAEKMKEKLGVCEVRGL